MRLQKSLKLFPGLHDETATIIIIKNEHIERKREILIINEGRGEE